MFPVPVASYQLPRFLSLLLSPPTSLVLLLCAAAKCVELHLCFVFLPLPSTHTHILAHRLVQSTCLHLQCRFIFVNLWWKNSHDEGKHGKGGEAGMGRESREKKKSSLGKCERLSPLFYTLSQGNRSAFMLIRYV